MRRHPGQSVTAIVITLFLAIAAIAVAQTKADQQPPAATSAQTTTTPPKTAESKAQGSTPPAPLTPQQAQLQAQIEKLYQLAQDLKAAVAKSDKDTLSIDVIKKAEAVEKAAKGLKDQMKDSPQSADHH